MLMPLVDSRAAFQLWPDWISESKPVFISSTSRPVWRDISKNSLRRPLTALPVSPAVCLIWVRLLSNWADMRNCCRAPTVRPRAASLPWSELEACLILDISCWATLPKRRNLLSESLSSRFRPVERASSSMKSFMSAIVASGTGDRGRGTGYCFFPVPSPRSPFFTYFLFNGFRVNYFLIVQQQAVAFGQGHVKCSLPGDSQFHQSYQLLPERFVVVFETPPSAGRVPSSPGPGCRRRRLPDPGPSRG